MSEHRLQSITGIEVMRASRGDPEVHQRRRRAGGGETRALRSVVRTVSAAPPCHRVIMAVDIERSTSRTNTERAWLRQVMYELFEDALRSGGIANHHDPLIDRGDGILALIHPVDQVPKTVLLTTVIPRLRDLLADCNTTCPEQQLRLRTVVHAGEVHYDNRGCYGEALDLAVRLLDAPEVKGRLRCTAQPLVLVVSENIYQSLVRHGYGGIDGDAFDPLVQVKIDRRRHRGWVHVPNNVPK